MVWKLVMMGISNYFKNYLGARLASVFYGQTATAKLLG